MLTFCYIFIDKMNKLLATRISEEDKVKFKEIAKSYKISESSLLRMIISVVINDKGNILLEEVLKKLGKIRYPLKKL